ncbi:hypothetical protein WJX74_009513 [Apatococcus lobatus]|uniref:Uncharacterized protein n=2 Tax=Apatococcus TaxID=904362 RepID=A0AAW1SFV0_9CHLO
MASQATGLTGPHTSPLFSWAADCGAHSHSNSCPVRQCALAAPRVRWSAARIAATKAAQQANRRKQSSSQASSSQQSQPSTTATYPEPETEKERSPLDYPQEWITPQPSRRPDIFPDFEKLDTPMPKPMPGDPEIPDEEEEEEEEKKKKDPDKEDPEKENPEEPQPDGE